MPTSGEARIRPTSTYNLRSRPLPKTRSVTSAVSSSSKNKENLLHPTSKLKKSQIPMPVRFTPSSRAKSDPTVKSANPASGRPKSRTRTVPDFAKLHKSWQQTFNKGKACNKKKCTEVLEFDLTKPGAVFQPKYYDGKTTSEEDEVFQTDEGALHGILNEGVSATSHHSGRSTMTGLGGSVVTQPKPTRQTLGSLPRAFQGRANNLQNTRNPLQFERLDAKGEQPREQDNPLEQEQRKTRSSSRRKESLAEQQQGMDINFESDADARASILNSTGADFRQRKAPLTRQTIGATMGVGRTPHRVFSGRPSQGPVRTSIYQRPRNMNYNRIYKDYENLLLSRLSLAAPPVTSKPLTFDQSTLLHEKSGSVVTQPKPTRQTLGSLPRAFQGRANNLQNTRNPLQFERLDAKGEQPREQDNPLEQEQRKTRSSSRRKESLAEQQQGMDINFESDADARASILNSTGADFRQRKAPLTRQTIGATMGVGRTPHRVFSGRPSQNPVRTSIYQRPRNMNYNRIYKDYENLLLSRLSLAAPPVTSKPLTFDQSTLLHEKILPQSGSKVRGQDTEAGGQSTLIKCAARRTRTPATASRVRNQRFQDAVGAQDTTSSPALRAPPSALRKATSTHKEGKAYSVKWADVLSPPGERTAARPCKDELATTLFTDDDAQFIQPDSVKPNVMEQESLQAACLAKQDEIQQLEKQAAIHRSELEDMNEIERQLELEIEKLQLEGTLLSPTSGSPDSRTDADNHPDKNPILFCPDASSLHTQRNFPDVQTLKQDHFSRPDLNSLQVPSAVNEGVSEAVTSPIEVAAQGQSVGGRAPSQGNQHSVPSLPVNETVATNTTTRTLATDQPFQIVDVPEKPLAEQSRVSEAEVECKMVEPNYQAALSPGLTSSSSEFEPKIQVQGCSGSQNEDVFRTSGRPNCENQPHISNRNYDHGLSSNQYGQMPNKETKLLRSDSVKIFLNQPLALNQFVNQGFPSSTSSASVHGSTLPSSVYNMASSLQTPLRDPQLSRVGMTVESFKEPFNPGNKEQVEKFTGDLPSSWMSSTPAPIQTPHAVKPHSMIKQLALKQSLPSSSLPGSQRVSQHSPPIHTPLAMRTMSTWNNEEFGASPIQYVSPVGNHSGQTPQRESKQEGGAEMHHPIPVQPQRDIPNGNPTSVTAATPNLSNTINHLQPAERMKPTSSLKTTGQGSLSLGAELLTSGGAAAFLKSKMKPLLSAKTDQLFQEALLDEECALYACRLPSKFGPRIAENRLCFDPVAKILMDGDDMHFVPIQSKGKVYISSPIGSAFNMYSNISS